MSKILDEKRNDLLTRMEEVVAPAQNDERELTPEEVATLNDLNDQLAAINEQIEAVTKTLSTLAGAEKPDSEPTEEEEMNEERELENRAMNEEKAFEAYVRGTLNQRDADYDMVKANNGAIIPASIANRIIKKVFEISPIAARADRYNVKGKLTIPYYDESSQAITVGFVTEGTAPYANSGDFTSITLNGYLAGALAKIGKDLIANTQFDVIGFIVDDMAEKLARFIEKEIIAPSDSTYKVKGLSTLTNKVTAASTSVITTDELVKLRDKVKDVYQQNAIWVMHPSTRTALRLLQDNAGHYLLNDDISSPFGTTLMGKPVYVSENVEEIAAGKNVIFYGDFKGVALKFSEEIDVQVLREAFAAEFCVGVVGTVDFDAVLSDQQKLAKLVMAAG